MEFEVIAPKNIEALASLMVALWPDCVFEEELDYCRKMLDSDQETAFLCKDANGQYVAFIQLSLRYEHVEGTNSSPVGYVEGIFVESTYRHTGIGRKLVERGKEWARKRGCVEMASDAEWHNTGSQDFHGRLGFEEVNRVVCYRMGL